ncbi:hypothetical protein K432DRAFT_73131 [Lepidopterella palustris CBS 459.81]|uniref:Uncharacterized protein n=1 Tax=Lepidopterella palustris CBS 459.81 TaxID=1314670 RepID=A0A8E2EJG7_9PEZI|nr:hypothetical protein K432DRAFT_73131 [Lepidopterella palustris CBS 459.81]
MFRAHVHTHLAPCFQLLQARSAPRSPTGHYITVTNNLSCLCDGRNWSSQRPLPCDKDNSPVAYSRLHSCPILMMRARLSIKYRRSYG